MIRLLSIAGLACLAVGCDLSPPKPAEPAPPPVAEASPAPAPAAELQTAGGPGFVTATAVVDGDRFLFTCTEKPRAMRVDVAYPDGDGATPNGAVIELEFGAAGKKLSSPASESTTEGYKHTAVFAADGDLLTAFYQEEPVIVRYRWKNPDGGDGSATAQMPSVGANQFGTDCAQITGQR